MADAKRLVLVVDDDRDLLSMLEMLLSSSEVEVHLANNGAEALEFVERAVPDLIFLDVRMPVMSGYEFAGQLRERCNARVPIVVLTAALDAKHSADEMGAEDFLAKPFELDDLIGKVQYHLGTPLAD